MFRIQSGYVIMGVRCQECWAISAFSLLAASTTARQNMAKSLKPTRSFSIQFGVYVLLLLAIVSAMFWSRRAAERRYGTVEAQADWQAWRSAVERQVENRGVDRRVPQSPAPPVLVLLREHFVACLAIGLIISSALYWTLALMIAGVWSSPSRKMAANGGGNHQ
jgi:hypothetical protein